MRAFFFGSKSPITTSYYTFIRRCDKEWRSPPLFERRVADGISCELSCFEVCALGNIPEHARKTIRYLVGKKAARKTLKTLAKLAIATSYYTFNRATTRNGYLHLCLRGALSTLMDMVSQNGLHEAHSLCSL